MGVQMVFQIILLLCSIYAIFVQAGDLAITSSCQERCGNVSIPYPFGIGADCYLDEWFEVVCNDSLTPPKLVLKKLDFEVLNISLETLRTRSSTVHINYPILSACGDDSNSTQNVELAKSPFIFSQYENIFIAIGCNNFARMTSSDGSVIGCRSICHKSQVIKNTTSSCHGYNCCQTAIASNLDAFNTTIEPINTMEPIMEAGCKYAFLAEEKWFETAYPFSNMSTYAPVVLDWGIPNTSLIIPPHIAKANYSADL